VISAVPSQFTPNKLHRKVQSSTISELCQNWSGLLALTSDPHYFGWVSREHTIQISDRRLLLVTRGTWCTTVAVTCDEVVEVHICILKSCDTRSESELMWQISKSAPHNRVCDAWLWVFSREYSTHTLVEHVLLHIGWEACTTKGLHNMQLTSVLEFESHPITWHLFIYILVDLYTSPSPVQSYLVIRF